MKLETAAAEQADRMGAGLSSMMNRKRWAVLVAGVTVIAVAVIVVAPTVAVKRRRNKVSDVSSASTEVVTDTITLTSTTPTSKQTKYPTTTPSLSPITSPTASPTLRPTKQNPTAMPTLSPTSSPTTNPTLQPSAETNTRLTSIPTPEPSPSLTLKPSPGPTSVPAAEPTTTMPTTTEPTAASRTMVSRLSIQQFKDNIETLSNFGDRRQGTTSYYNAENWLQGELERYGYTVEAHAYRYRGSPRTNMYVTKVGTLRPDRMYIVSAHLDGRGGGGAANDDGSGCSLVLEMARVLASADLTVESSIRMVFWNNEETGLNGAQAYVDDRASLQGQESPAGSGLFPEPTWLGIVTHDQILFDHGLPVQENQIPNADSDIEYQANSAFSSQSRILANTLRAGNEQYAEDYPAEVSGDMCCTDSVPFQNLAPSVSIRENRRRAEIGSGSQPHWHQPTDLFSTFSEADFLFGFNVVQTTVGTICDLSGVSLDRN